MWRFTYVLIVCDYDYGTDTSTPTQVIVWVGGSTYVDYDDPELQYVARKPEEVFLPDLEPYVEKHPSEKKFWDDFLRFLVLKTYFFV